MKKRIRLLTLVALSMVLLAKSHSAIAAAPPSAPTTASAATNATTSTTPPFKCPVAGCPIGIMHAEAGLTALVSIKELAAIERRDRDLIAAAHKQDADFDTERAGMQQQLDERDAEVATQRAAAETAKAELETANKAAKAQITALEAELKKLRIRAQMIDEINSGDRDEHIGAVSKKIRRRVQRP